MTHGHVYWYAPLFQTTFANLFTQICSSIGAVIILLAETGAQ